MTALAEACLLAFVLAATLGAGALVVRAAGLLLRERWLEPLAPIFTAAGRLMPLLLLLALPVLLFAGALYPWAGGPRAVPVLSASGTILLLWAFLGWWLARPAATRRAAGAALLIVVLTAAIGFEEWALSRDAGWVGSLNGIAMLVGGAAAFLGLAVLLQGCPEDAEARTGLERALLTLGVFALWFLFVPYVTVWAADLPPEAAWYLRRQEGVWLWMKLGVILPALIGAILLSAMPQWRPWRMRLVCSLLLLQHVALVLWTVRPDAGLAPGAAHGAPNPLADAIVIGLAALVLLLLARRAARSGTEAV